jgi:hypothetical protein
MVLAQASCTFQTKVPATAHIACSTDGGSAPCPSGFKCQPALGRCVDDAELLQPAVGVVASSISLTPPIGNLSTPFALKFQVTRALAFAPRAAGSRFSVQGATGEVTSYPFSCSECDASLSCSCTFRPDPANPPPEGPLQVAIAIVDTAGNAPPSISAGSLDLDYTPPQLVPPVQMTVLPGPDVSTPVTEVGPQGGASICFAVNEALASTPHVYGATSASAPADLDLSLSSSLGNGYCFSLVRDGGWPADGVQGVFAQVQDVAGNAATLTVIAADPDGGLIIDTTPPSPPALDLDGGLRYRRAPWGELPSSAGVPSFSVSATGVDAIPTNGWLLISADQAGEIELARVPVSSGPLAPVSLVPQDWPEVWVNLADGAGNRLSGGAVRVRNVDWVANLGRKQPGDTTDNPNACHARHVSLPVLVEPDDPYTELGAPASDGGADTVAAQPTWRLRVPGGQSVDPGGFDYDTARGRTVAYTTVNFTTYEYDGVDWLPTQPIGVVPSDRYGAAMAYDSKRGRSVLFGGYDAYSSTQLNFCDTWEWDGNIWQLRSDCHDAVGEAPPTRYEPCFAYDPGRARSVLVDGFNDQSDDIGDQWEWDGQHWTALATAPSDGGTPFGSISCYYAAMGYLDVDGGELVAVGSNLPGGIPAPDAGDTFDDGGSWITWLGRWTGDTYAWQAGPVFSAWDTPLEVTPDPVRNEMGMLVATPVDYTYQLWRWDGSSPGWLLAANIPAVPPPTGSHEITLLWGGPADPVHPWRVVYWAEIGTSTVTITFRCGLHATNPDAACVPDHHSSTLPGDGVFGGLSFDAKGRALLEGLAPDGGDQLGFWIWDGMDWSDGPTGPRASMLGPLTYQPVDEHFWLYSGGTADGGLLQQFWVTDLDGGWAQRTDDSNPTAVPFAIVFVPDAGIDESVLAFDRGTDPASELTWNGTALDSSPLAPAPYGTPAYDPVRGKLVMACGYPSGDFEETSPPAFSSWSPAANGLFAECTSVWDPSSQQMLTVGGEGLAATPVAGDVAVWDGTSLTHLELADAEADGNPQTPNYTLVAADPLRHTVLALTDVAHSTATWELSMATVRPDVVCQFAFGSAQADPAAVLTGVRVQVEAASATIPGVSATPVPQPTQLSVWRDAQWERIATCTATDCPANLGTIDFQISDPAELSSLLWDLQMVGVAVGPEAADGRGTVTVRNPQVVVSYQLP